MAWVSYIFETDTKAVWPYTCVHVYVSLYMSVYLCARECLYMCLCVCVHVFIHVSLCLCACVCLCVYVCVCVRMYMYVWGWGSGRISLGIEKRCYRWRSFLVYQSIMEGTGLEELGQCSPMLPSQQKASSNLRKGSDRSKAPGTRRGRRQMQC